MRHLMEPDPDRKGPTFTQALWLHAFILAVVVFVALLAKAHGG